MQHPFHKRQGDWFNTLFHMRETHTNKETWLYSCGEIFEPRPIFILPFGLKLQVLCDSSITVGSEQNRQCRGSGVEKKRSRAKSPIQNRISSWQYPWLVLILISRRPGIYARATSAAIPKPNTWALDSVLSMLFCPTGAHMVSLITWTCHTGLNQSSPWHMLCFAPT